MILTRISDYLRRHGRASVTDMSCGLDTAPDALTGMLSTLERKGRVRRLPGGTSCGKSCGKCDPHAVELYEWVGD
jgi:Mn-dependent DtxR family transcriptional regulator